MAENFTVVGLALEVADLGTSLLKATKRHSKTFGASSHHDSLPTEHRAVKDYIGMVDASSTEVLSTTEVLNLAAIQLDVEELGQWSSNGGMKTASRALELSKSTFNAIREQFLLSADQVIGSTSYLIAGRCDDAADKLASYNKDLERARTSLLLMLAVLKLKRDTSSRYDDASTDNEVEMLTSYSDDTLVKLQRLQVQNLAAQMQAIGLGDLESADGSDSDSEAGSVESKSDVTSIAEGMGTFMQHTPGTTPNAPEPGSLEAKTRSERDKDLAAYSWALPAEHRRSRRAGSAISIASSSASSDSSQSTFLRSPAQSTQIVDSGEVDTLLLQAAHSASSLAAELATETHSWHKSHRLNSNAIRGSLEMVKSRVEGLLGTFEQCKGTTYLIPVSLLGPTVITDIVDCVPSNVRGPSPAIKDRHKSSKKYKRKRSSKSKKTKKPIDQAYHELFPFPGDRMAPPAPPPGMMMPPPPPPGMMMPPPPPPGMTDPFYAGGWDLPPEPNSKAAKKSKKKIAPEVDLTVPLPPPAPSMGFGDPFAGMSIPSATLDKSTAPAPPGLNDPFANFGIGPMWLPKHKKKSRKAKVRSVKDDDSEDERVSSDSDTSCYRPAKKQDVVAELLGEWTKEDGGDTTSGEDI